MIWILSVFTFLTSISNWSELIKGILPNTKRFYAIIIPGEPTILSILCLYPNPEMQLLQSIFITKSLLRLHTILTQSSFRVEMHGCQVDGTWDLFISFCCAHIWMNEMFLTFFWKFIFIFSLFIPLPFMSSWFLKYKNQRFSLVFYKPYLQQDVAGVGSRCDVMWWWWHSHMKEHHDGCLYVCMYMGNINIFITL